MRAPQSARARMEAARSRLVINAPFFGCLALHLELTEADPAAVDTMATDGRRLFYSAAFVETLPDAEIEGTIAHECMHCALGHHARMGRRELATFNEAADYAINPDILAAGFRLPAGVLVNPDFAGLGAEEIYSILMRGKAGQPGQPQSGQNSPAGGQAGSAGQSQAGGQSPAATGQQSAGSGQSGQPGQPGGQSAGQPRAGQQSGSGQPGQNSAATGPGQPGGPSQAAGQPSGNGSTGGAAMGQPGGSGGPAGQPGGQSGQPGGGSAMPGAGPAGGNGQPMPAAGQPNGSGPAGPAMRQPGLGKPGAYGFGGILPAADPATAAAEADRWQVITRQAVAVATKAAGKLPAYLQNTVRQLAEPVADFRALLAEFIDSRVAFDYSFSRPNRRFAHAGVYLPGAIVDGFEHVVFAVDSSGSMTQPMLDAAVTEVAGAMESGKFQRLTVVQADTRVTRVDRFEHGEPIKVRIAGGGGTDFRQTFEWIEEHAADASAIVYLTDLIVDEFGREPACPVLWAVHGDSRRFRGLASKAPFGDAVYIGRL